MARSRRQLLRDMVPLKDIYRGGVAENRVNGALFIVLQITPASLGLRDRSDRLELLRAYHDFVQRLPCDVQIAAYDVTPNLDAYLEELEEGTHRTDCAALRGAAVEFRGQLCSLLAGQRVREKRFYLVLSQPAGTRQLSPLALFLPSARARLEGQARNRRAAQAEGLRQRGRDLAAHLTRMGLPTRLCREEELLNLFRRLYDPTRPEVHWAQATRQVTAAHDSEGDHDG